MSTPPAKRRRLDAVAPEQWKVLSGQPLLDVERKRVRTTMELVIVHHKSATSRQIDPLLLSFDASHGTDDSDRDSEECVWETLQRDRGYTWTNFCQMMSRYPCVQIDRLVLLVRGGRQVSANNMTTVLSMLDRQHNTILHFLVPTTYIEQTKGIYLSDSSESDSDSGQDRRRNVVQRQRPSHQDGFNVDATPDPSNAKRAARHVVSLLELYFAAKSHTEYTAFRLHHGLATHILLQLPPNFRCNRMAAHILTPYQYGSAFATWLVRHTVTAEIHSYAALQPYSVFGQALTSDQALLTDIKPFVSTMDAQLVRIFTDIFQQQKPCSLTALIVEKDHSVTAEAQHCLIQALSSYTGSLRKIILKGKCTTANWLPDLLALLESSCLCEVVYHLTEDLRNPPVIPEDEQKRRSKLILETVVNRKSILRCKVRGHQVDKITFDNVISPMLVCRRIGHIAQQLGATPSQPLPTERTNDVERFGSLLVHPNTRRHPAYMFALISNTHQLLKHLWDGSRCHRLAMMERKLEYHESESARIKAQIVTTRHYLQ